MTPAPIPTITPRWAPDDLPAEARLVLDPSVRRIDGGRSLIGGSPLRILRVSAAGAAAIDAWAAGEEVGASAGRRRLARRLLEGGLAHPRFAGGPFGPDDVTCVVAVHDHAHLLIPTLDALRSGPPLGAVIVADDQHGIGGAVQQRLQVVSMLRQPRHVGFDLLGHAVEALAQP